MNSEIREAVRCTYNQRGSIISKKSEKTKKEKQKDDEKGEPLKDKKESTYALYFDFTCSIL